MTLHSKYANFKLPAKAPPAASPEHVAAQKALYENDGRIGYMPPDNLLVDRNSPINDDNVRDIAASLKLMGMLAHITAVRRADGRVEVVCGHHRWHAARRIGMKTVPVAVLLQGTSPEMLASVKLDENLRRNQIPEPEKARLMAASNSRMKAEGVKTQGQRNEQNAAKFGHSPATARRHADRAKTLGPETYTQLLEKKVAKRDIDPLCAMAPESRKEMVDRILSGEPVNLVAKVNKLVVVMTEQDKGDFRDF